MSILDQFADYLLRRGYQTGLVHQFVRAAEHYGHWLGTRHAVVTADHVTKASARQFLHEHLPVCSCSARLPPQPHPEPGGDQPPAADARPARPGSPAATADSARPSPDRVRPFPPADLWALRAHAHLPPAERPRFLDRHFGDAPAVPDRLRPADLQDYFRRHAGHLKPGSVAVLASSLRSFFRFLALSHGFDPSLAGVVPAAPQWPKDRLPKSLTEGDLRAVLAHFDARTATGRRDLAMMRCMSDLGLRVSEVVALTLDDIDWRRGVVTIRGDKGRRGRALPLPAPLGRAITAYLSGGRPSSADRHLFLRHTVPVRHSRDPRPDPRRLPPGVCHGHGAPESVGTHVLRHTAAARMRAAGHSLKGIADVLGHRSVDTTAIYVKLDVEALRAVALPWPGGAS